MKFPLTEFEQFIDEAILKRGLSYFKNGRVSPPEEVAADEYESIVKGTEDYTVSFKLKNGTLSDAACTCPYQPAVCKHIAAVCFYLQQDELGIDSKPKKEKTAGTTKNPLKKISPKTVAQKIEDLLANLPREEINDFIRSQCKKTPLFRQTFLTVYAHLFEDESIDLYRKQVSTILKSAASRGFIDYYNAGKAGKEITGLLNTAKEFAGKGRELSATYICFAIVREVTGALEHSDDSNGYLGDNIENALVLLFALTGKNADKGLRENIFATALQYFDDKYFSGWDWHLQMLQLAKETASSPAQCSEIRKRLAAITGSDYEGRSAQQIELEIIKATDGEDAAQEFLKRNISNPDFRKKYMEQLIAGKKYTEAKQVARDGIAKDKQYAGLVQDWYEGLLKIALAENDTEDVKLLARKLYFEAGERSNTHFYDILKKQIPANEWSGYAMEMVNEWKKHPYWHTNSRVADIYIREKWWDKLFELLKGYPDLNFIEQNEKHLSKSYAPQLAELYEKGILDYLKGNVSRSHYKHACHYIKKMIRLGEKSRADQLVKNLRRLYVQRRALIEELAAFQ